MRIRSISFFKGLSASFLFILLVSLTLGFFFFSLQESSALSGSDTAQTQATCGLTSCNCGDQISVSRTLNSSDNLTNCASTGFILQISASDVVLDCNHFLLSSNGSSTSGISASSGLTNLTIQNCPIFNVSGPSINFVGTGNYSLIQYNNFTGFNRSGAVATGVTLVNDVTGVVIRGNYFNTSLSLPGTTGILIQSAENITVQNNTFDSVPIAIGTSGVATNVVANITIMNNNYSMPQVGIQLGALSFKNVTIRNENITGTSRAVLTQDSGQILNVIFINTTQGNGLLTSRGIKFNLANTTYTSIPNLSSQIFLYTLSASILTFNRNITLWNAANLTFQENYSSFGQMNYTFYTSNTVGGLYFLIDGILNKSMTFNSAGDTSGIFGFDPGVVHNLTVIMDTTAPNITVLNPLTELDPGTTNTLLNISTDENASCRYGTSNVAFASLSTPFTSTTNFTHYATLTGLENGTSYTYYVACQDLVQNTGATRSVNFSEAAAPVVTPVSDSSGGGGGGGSSSSSSSSSSTENSTQTNTSSTETSSVTAISSTLPQSSLETNEPINNSIFGETPSKNSFLTLFGQNQFLFFFGLLVLLLFLLFWALHYLSSSVKK